MKATFLRYGVMLSAVFWAVSSACADERKVAATVSLRQEYIDNLFWSSQSEESDYITTISPALELTSNTERLKTGAKIQLHDVYYYDNSDLNDIDQEYSAHLRYAFSPRANMATSARFRRDSRNDSEFTDTGLVVANVSRDRYTYRLGGDYALSEVMGAQLEYGFDGDYYAGSTLSDYTSHSVSLLLNRDLSIWLPRTTGRVNLSAAVFDLSGSEVTTWSGTVGGERSLDEHFSFFGDIGLTYTESVFDSVRLAPSGIPGVFVVQPYEQYADGTGVVGKAGVTYKGEFSNARIFLSRGVSAASGRDGTVTRTALQGEVGRQLNETSRVTFSTGYVVNKGEKDKLAAVDIDERSVWLRPKIRYSLTDQLAVEASYSYDWVDDMVDESTVQRNLVMLELVYEHTLWE